MISHTSTPYLVYKTYITLLSLFSPYLYISIAAFRLLHLFDGQNTIMAFVEISFIINVGVNFLTDFTVEGETNPRRKFD